MPEVIKVIEVLQGTEDSLKRELEEWEKKEEAEEKKKTLEEKEAKSYDRIMKEENMITNATRQATVDSTAAEEYEDDFM